MKRFVGLLAATALLSGGAVSVSSGAVGAATGRTPFVPLLQTIDLPASGSPGVTQVYAVHGLNLDGQKAQSDGGTPVTLCVDDLALIPDFEFGQVYGPAPIPVGSQSKVTVFRGAQADCSNTDPIITQFVAFPGVAAQAMVVTAGPGGVLQLLQDDLDVSAQQACLQPVVGATPQGSLGLAGLQPLHAAAAGPVAVTISDYAVPPGSFGFGRGFIATPSPGVHQVEVTLDDTPIIGPVNLTLERCTLTVMYVVGNQPIAERDGLTGEEPIAATAAADPAAQAVDARPAFTG